MGFAGTLLSFVPTSFGYAVSPRRTYLSSTSLDSLPVPSGAIAPRSIREKVMMNGPSDATNQNEGENAKESDRVDRDAFAASPRRDRHENEGPVGAERNDPMEASEVRSLADEGNDAFAPHSPPLANEVVPDDDHDDFDHDRDHGHSSAQAANERNSDAFRE